MIWQLTDHAIEVPADRAHAETCLSELAAHCRREHLEIVRIEVNRRWFAEGIDSE